VKTAGVNKGLRPRIGHFRGDEDGGERGHGDAGKGEHEERTRAAKRREDGNP